MRTHSELCLVGAKFLRTICREKFPIVFVEVVSTANEIADVIGFNSVRSALIEVKISRSDFKADQKKFCRKFPEQGMGVFRYYLCPENLIAESELPNKWGLIYVSDKGKCTVIKEIITGNCGNDTKNMFQRNLSSEISVMYSVLRRNQKRLVIK